MQILLICAVILLSYLIGAIPLGLITVKLSTGQDIRQIQSGRTGGTNAMRAAGLWIGILTAFGDVAKGIIGVWLARAITPGNVWMEIIAPTLIIIGHNYSVFTINKTEGRLQIGGGAGGAPSVGGAVGLWPPMFFILIPLGVLILFGIGYASLATISLPLIATFIFIYRAWNGVSPWQYILFGLISEVLIIWSLRPNIKRLINGNERLVGWRARRAESKSPEDNTSQNQGPI
jgi:glycerol-3-phosphate acyltransferase PlsY